MATGRLLLVEDEPSLVLTLTDRLESEGYSVVSVGNGDDAFDEGKHDFDLILLDVALPGRDGFDVCRDLRQAGVTTPILMLTARSQVVDRVVGLKLGADDYLTKPFEMAELLARVEAVLRRSRPRTGTSAEHFRFADIEVDLDRAEVRRQGQPLMLSGLEFRLLRYFLENAGRVLSRDELLDKVWGYDSTTYTRTVDVHVSSLRQKIESNPARPEFLATVHGLGYRFDLERRGSSARS